MLQYSASDKYHEETYRRQSDGKRCCFTQSGQKWGTWGQRPERRERMSHVDVCRKVFHVEEGAKAKVLVNPKQVNLVPWKPAEGQYDRNTAHKESSIRAERWPGARSQILQGLQVPVKTRFYCSSVRRNHWRFSETLCFPSPKTPQGVAWPKLLLFKRSLWLLWGEQSLWSRETRRPIRRLLQTFRREKTIVWTRLVKVEVEWPGRIQNAFHKLTGCWQTGYEMWQERVKDNSKIWGHEPSGNGCGGAGNQGQDVHVVSTGRWRGWVGSWLYELEFRVRLQIGSRDCRYSTVGHEMASDRLVGTRTEGRNGALQ